MRIQALTIEDGVGRHQAGLDVDEAVALLQAENFVWLDLDISDYSLARLQKLLIDRLGFHPATLSDCVTPTPFHQAKLDEEEDYKFISFIYYTGGLDRDVQPQELNIYTGGNYVITVHREPIPQFLERFRHVPPSLEDPSEHAIMFLQHILDVVIDSFAPLLIEIKDRSDALELAILSQRPAQREPGQAGSLPAQLSDMRHILRASQMLVMLRRTLHAEQAILLHLIDEYDYNEAPESSKKIAIYFRDISDHIAKYLEIIETEDRALTHLMEIHHLVTNARTNEIIIILTIVSAVMLPLNLIVGFFGMNQQDMWLIHSHHGTLAVLITMALIAGSLVYYFKRKRWI